MSEILTYGNRLVTDAQIMKMGTFTSKGGGLMIQVQLPLDSGLAGNIATHLGNMALMTLEFSSAKAASQGAPDRRQGSLGLEPTGPSQPPAPEDQTHQAGVDRIASTCPACGGTSYVGEGSEEACDTCGGTGVVYTAPGVRLAMVACGSCDGSGNKPDAEGTLERCLICQGSGKVAAEVTDDPMGDAAAEFEEEQGQEDEAEDEDQAGEVEEEPASEASA